MSRHTLSLHHALAYIFTMLLRVSLVSSTACYAPDGSVNSDTAYVPCSDDTSNPLHTICCALNRSLPDGIPDICSPNGLCQQGKNESQPASDPKWTKSQCTNANWDEPGCLHVCGDQNVQWITPCDKSAGNASTKWCCGFENTACCNEGAHLQVENVPVNFDPNNGTTTSSSAATITATTSTSVISSSASATTTRSSDSQSQTSGLSTGAEAGIGIGAAIGGMLLLALGIYLGKHLRAKKNTEAGLHSHETYGDGSHGIVTYAHESVPTTYVELGNHETRDAQEKEGDVKVDLAARRGPTELP